MSHPRNKEELYISEAPYYTLSAGFLHIWLNAVIGANGFEPSTSCSQGRRANQTALRPVIV